MELNVNVNGGKNRKNHWEEMVELWKESGLSRAAFCRLHDLTYTAFLYWCRKNHSDSPCKMVAVPCDTDTRTFRAVNPVPIRLVLGSCHLEIPTGFDGFTLKQVLQVLQEVS
jgi:hypothetical protein